jgi:hypothetical protein
MSGNWGEEQGCKQHKAHEVAEYAVLDEVLPPESEEPIEYHCQQEDIDERERFGEFLDLPVELVTDGFRFDCR